MGHCSSCTPGSFGDRSQWVEGLIVIALLATRGDEYAVGFPIFGKTRCALGYNDRFLGDVTFRVLWWQVHF